MINLKNKTLFDLIQLYITENITIELIIGTFYLILHFSYALLLLLLLLFCFNINYLFIIIIIISLNLYTIYLLKRCPLELLEYKYINTCLFKLNNKSVKTLNNKLNKPKYLTKFINKNINENILEYFIICWIVFVIKILIIILIN